MKEDKRKLPAETLASRVAEIAEGLGIHVDADTLEWLTAPAFAAACGALTYTEALFATSYCATLDIASALGISGFSGQPSPDLRLAIQTGLSSIGTQQKLMGARLVEELARIAFFDWSRLPLDVDTVPNLRQLPRDVSAAIKSIKYTKGTGQVEIRLYDKVQALQTLYKMMGEPTLAASGFDHPAGENAAEARAEFHVYEFGRRQIPESVDDEKKS